MNKIEAINNDIKTITLKLQIGARDWNKSEKEAIAHAYFEITKVSTTKARNLDTGCVSCVNGAVTIIVNYLAAIGTPVEVKVGKQRAAAKAKTVVSKDNGANADEVTTDESEDGLVFAPTDKAWRKNHETIDAAAKELEYVFAEDVKTKGDKIEALEKHIKTINE